LLDTLLRSLSVDAQRVHGYDSGEFTHAAVAAFVASGMARVGFGVEAAARQFKLNFLPMMEDHYMLACRTESLRKPAIRELILLLQGQEFEETMRQVPGYSLDNAGEIVTVQDVFPWLAKLG
jgi:molybdate-binding protein